LLKNIFLRNWLRQPDQKLAEQNTEEMKYLFVGLGNIGPEYADTRHNVGFMVVDQMAKQAEVRFESGRYAFKAELKHKGRQIHLIKPTTYMNLSGKAVNYWMKELKIPAQNIVVVVDELALPFGKLRMRAKGSAAGHNGLKDIEARLGGNAYPRLRFGIGDDFPKGRQVDYVLSPFNDGEYAELGIHLERAVEMLKAFATIGINNTMSQYNN